MTLEDTRAGIDEVVADTTFQIPLERATAPIPFENFRYPYVDAAENVLFIGNDPFYGANGGNGIFRSVAATGKLETVVSSDDPAPDDGLPIGTIMGLNTDFESLVFHRGPDRGKGLYGVFDDQLVSLACHGTPVPDVGLPFDWFWYADVQSGNVVFNGTYGGDLEIHGLYWYSVAGLKRLVDESQSLAQAEGLRLGYVSYQPRMDRSWIVFGAQRQDAQGNVLTGRGILGWPLKMAADGTVDPSQLTLDRLQVLAPFGMPLPESGGLPLTAAPSPNVGEGIIATMAGGLGTPRDEYPPYQCILVRTPEGDWRNPLDTNTIIPNLPGETRFTSFDKWLAIDQGLVIFRALGEGGYEAIYGYDVETDTLYFFLDNRREVEGRQIEGFEISTNPLAGRRLAVMIQFDDGTSGVYLATLPGLPVHPRRVARTVP